MTNILLAFLLINAWTFVMFGWDKVQAEKFQWRVSEATLLRLALFGGSLGAYAGRALFRHKTRKQPFNSRLQNIGLIQLAALTFCGVYFYEPGGLSTPAQAERVQTFAQRPPIKRLLSKLRCRPKRRRCAALSGRSRLSVAAGSRQ